MTCQRAMRGERSAWPVRPNAEGLYCRSDGLAAVQRVPSDHGSPAMYRALRLAAYKSHDSHESPGTNATNATNGTNGTNEPAAWEELFAWCRQSLAIAERDCDRAVAPRMKEASQEGPGQGQAEKKEVRS